MRLKGGGAVVQLEVRLKVGGAVVQLASIITYLKSWAVYHSRGCTASVTSVNESVPFLKLEFGRLQFACCLRCASVRVCTSLPRLGSVYEIVHLQV